MTAFGIFLDKNSLPVSVDLGANDIQNSVILMNADAVYIMVVFLNRIYTLNLGGSNGFSILRNVGCEIS
jgi:hypothetical protein